MKFPIRRRRRRQLWQIVPSQSRYSSEYFCYFLVSCLRAHRVSIPYSAHENVFVCIRPIDTVASWSNNKWSCQASQSVSQSPIQNENKERQFRWFATKNHFISFQFICVKWKWETESDSWRLRATGWCQPWRCLVVWRSEEWGNLYERNIFRSK